MSAPALEQRSWTAEAALFEEWNREVAREVARRRRELDEARAAVPDRGRFLTPRL